MGLYKRGKKWYCSIVDPNGKLIRKALSADKRTAEAILGGMRQQFEYQKAGILPMDLPDSPHIASLQDIKRKYLDVSKMRERSQSFFVLFEYAWRNVVGESKDATLTLDNLQNWAMKLKEGETTGQSINFYAGSLRSFVAWAISQGYMTKDPLAGWLPLKRSEKRFRRDLEPHEVVAILNSESDPVFRLRWEIYFATGLRSKAGAALAWDWIDWQNKLIILPIKANKSKRTARIPLHPTLEARLREFHEALGCPRDGSVFPPLTTHTILLRFKRACRKAGVDLSGICLHSVRHTVATVLFNASGKNLKVVQEMLDHASVATTALYLHVNDADKRDAVESIPYF